MTTKRYCLICKKMTVYFYDKSVGHSFCTSCNSSSQFARMKQPTKNKTKKTVPFNLKKHKKIKSSKIQTYKFRDKIMRKPKPSDLLIPEKNPITREELFGIIVVSIALIVSQNMGIAFLSFITYNIGIVIGHYLKT